MKVRAYLILALVLSLFAWATSASAQTRGPGQVRTDGGSTAIAGEVLQMYKDSVGGIIIVRENLITLSYITNERHAEVFVVQKDSPSLKIGDVLYPSFGVWSEIAKLEGLISTIKDAEIRRLAEIGRQSAMRHVSP